MEVLLVVALALVGAGFVVIALQRGVAAPPTDPTLDDLEARKATALEALLDLDEEHAVGKISDTDYAELKASYEVEAVTVMDEIDRVDGAAPDAIEREIAAVRARLARTRGPSAPTED